ncbi:argininosuccinate lyase [Bartonella chomelii]|uniref:Argininosuccinate lyase n=1 Tax=Bartonella chomelii TaxID=236402 RepID=A0ABR6E2Q5_9HYPH|nr:MULTISPECIES: hypothetical protein [Bartonella]MBA9082851.1 argininosuccinate lyase [Bartonella chomelii]
MEDINASIDCDQKLYRQDIEGSFSHVMMLAQTKIISHSDYEKIVHGLEFICQEVKERHVYFFTKA